MTSALESYVEEIDGVASPTLPLPVEREISSILEEAIDESKSDCILLTLFGEPEQLQLADSSYVFAASEVESQLGAIPRSFKSPTNPPSLVKDAFGIVSFPNGFESGDSLFDGMVREKAFAPVAVADREKEVKAVLCGIRFDEKVTAGFSRGTATRRCWLTAAWSIVQIGVSQLLSSSRSPIHQRFLTSIACLEALDGVSDLNEIAGCLHDALASFGIKGVEVRCVYGRQLSDEYGSSGSNVAAGRGLKAQPRSVNASLSTDVMTAYPLFAATSIGHGLAQGSYTYVNGEAGMWVRLTGSESSFTQTQCNILLTVLLERFLWLSNLNLQNAAIRF